MANPPQRSVWELPPSALAHPALFPTSGLLITA